MVACFQPSTLHKPNPDAATPPCYKHTHSLITCLCFVVKKHVWTRRKRFIFGVWRRDGRQHGNHHVVGGHRHAEVYRFHVADLHISAPNGCTHGPQRYETQLGGESVTKRDEFSLRVKARQRRTVAKRAANFFFLVVPPLRSSPLVLPLPSGHRGDASG